MFGYTTTTALECDEVLESRLIFSESPNTNQINEEDMHSYQYYQAQTPDYIENANYNILD